MSEQTNIFNSLLYIVTIIVRSIYIENFRQEEMLFIHSEMGNCCQALLANTFDRREKYNLEDTHVLSKGS